MDDTTSGAGWPADRLAEIDRAGEIHIAPARTSGGLRRPTRIWSVVVDDGLYVRAYRGPDSAWYRAADATGRGRVTAGGRTDEVTFARPDPGVDDEVDRAFADKYGSNSYVDAMVGKGPRATTLRVHPGG